MEGQKGHVLYDFRGRHFVSAMTGPMLLPTLKQWSRMSVDHIPVTWLVQNTHRHNSRARNVERQSLYLSPKHMSVQKLCDRRASIGCDSSHAIDVRVFPRTCMCSFHDAGR